MPIINGQYVNDSLLPAEAAQQHVFGEYTKASMADYSAAAYNYLMKQQEQAYNLELWHLQNEYNSPASQMQRYQDAGLNPNLVYGQQNVASSPAGASAPSFRSSGVAERQVQNTISLIGQMRNILESAFETYQYFSPHGRVMRSLAQEQGGLDVIRSQADADWLRYLTYGRLSGEDSVTPDMIPGSYRAQMYNLDANLKEANFNRVQALASMIPDQIARTQALTALDKYRQGILQGQNDAVLNIHTGNEAVDSWLKALMYFAMSKF